MTKPIDQVETNTRLAAPRTESAVTRDALWAAVRAGENRETCLQRALEHSDALRRAHNAAYENEKTVKQVQLRAVDYMFLLSMLAFLHGREVAQDFAAEKVQADLTAALDLVGSLELRLLAAETKLHALEDIADAQRGSASDAPVAHLRVVGGVDA